jgi:hypothetical protein
MPTRRLAVDAGDERTRGDERRARIEAMIAEYREAERRRIVKLGIALWNRTEAARRAKPLPGVPPPETVH